METDSRFSKLHMLYLTYACPTKSREKASERVARWFSYEVKEGAKAVPH